MTAAAEVAKRAGIERFLLLTAQGSTGLPSWVPRGVVEAVHPLLYTQTKHEAETAVLAQGFKNVSIFRPGLLDRRVPGADTRALESALLWVLPATHARSVGYAMAEDATTLALEPVREVSTSSIAKLAKAYSVRNPSSQPSL